LKSLNFISIQATFAQVSINLYKHGLCSATFIQDDRKASSHLIPFIDHLLKENALQLADLAFIAADCGPGAFTSLRVALATLNGIGFAARCPLVGIDGLEALTRDTFNQLHGSWQKPTPYLIVSLLNAYNNDVYYAFSQANADGFEIIEKGVMPIDECLQHELFKKFTHVAWNGNGLAAYKQACTKSQEGFTLLATPYLPVATAHSIGALGLEQFRHKSQAVFALQPNYIKTQQFAIKREFKTLKDF
jgi:tRNA threonylcarbamoyl adenosine modification protein YeaZ